MASLLLQWVNWAGGEWLRGGVVRRMAGVRELDERAGARRGAQGAGGVSCAPIPFGAVAALVFAWTMGVAPESDAGRVLDWRLGLAFQSLLYLVVIAPFPGVRRLVRRAWIVPAGCLAGMVGCGLRLALDTGALASAPSYAGFCTEVLMDASQALMMLWAMCRIARCPMRTVMVSVLAWQSVLSVPLVAARLAGGFAPEVVSLVVSPVGWALGALWQTRADRAAGPMFSEEACCTARYGAPFGTAHDDGVARTPYRLMAVVTVVVMTIYALRASVPPESLTLSHLGSFVMPVLLVVLFSANARIGKIRFLYDASLVMIAVAAFAVLAAGEPVVAAGSAALNGLAAMAADASYACFSTFYFVVLCGMSSRYGMDPVRLFSLAFGFECAGGLAGLLLADAAAGLGVGAGVFVGCLASVATVVFVCLPSNADYRTAWGTRGSRTGVESVTSFYYSLPETCTAVARSSGLSKREEEVLVLLVQRKSAPDIAAELCISTATVKSHSRSIYRKLGIHRREELLEMVGYPVGGPDAGDEG